MTKLKASKLSRIEIANNEVIVVFEVSAIRSPGVPPAHKSNSVAITLDIEAVRDAKFSIGHRVHGAKRLIKDVVREYDEKKPDRLALSLEGGEVRVFADYKVMDGNILIGRVTVTAEEGRISARTAGINSNLFGLVREMLVGDKFISINPPKDSHPKNTELPSYTIKASSTVTFISSIQRGERAIFLNSLNDAEVAHTAGNRRALPHAKKEEVLEPVKRVMGREYDGNLFSLLNTTSTIMLSLSQTIGHTRE